mmetsp:Transcript_40056/g.69354  ORF Transcript_40056/g.69354 Transcript_40056/m.69354 type:complete len:625 (+) Transcript_40056:680-2554(+)
MGLLVGVVGIVRRLAELLRDHQHADVHLVLQQVADCGLGVVDGALHVAVDDDLSETRVDHLTHEETVVTTHGLKTLRIQLVITVRAGPQQTSVTLLVHQQVRKVHLFELQLDRVRENRRYLPGGDLCQWHGLLHSWRAEVDHHRVRVSVDYLGVVFVAIRDGVLALHEGPRGEEQVASVGRDRRGDLQARQLAGTGAGETVHGVRRHLQGELATVLHGFDHLICGGGHVLFGAFACAEKLVENLRHDAFLRGGTDEYMSRRRLFVKLRIQLADVLSVHQRRVTKVVALHDGRVKRGEIQRSDGHLVVRLLWLNDRGTLEGILVSTVLGDVWDEQVHLAGLAQNHTKHFDLLASREDKVQGHAGHAGHLDVVHDHEQLVHQLLREISVLQTIHCQTAAVRVGTHLQIRNDRVVHIFLLLAQKLRGDRVQRVRRQLVVAEHIRQQVKDDASVDGGLDVLALAEGAALEGGVSHDGLHADQAAQVREAFQLRASLLQCLGAVQQVREIEVGDVVASDKIGVTGHHEVTPLHQQVLFSVTADHLRAHDGQTGVESEHVADDGRVRALQRDGVGDLNHLVVLRVRENALAAFALNVETQNAQRGDVAPLADALVVNDVVEEHIHLETAP